MLSRLQLAQMVHVWHAMQSQGDGRWYDKMMINEHAQQMLTTSCIRSCSTAVSRSGLKLVVFHKTVMLLLFPCCNKNGQHYILVTKCKPCQKSIFASKPSLHQICQSAQATQKRPLRCSQCAEQVWTVQTAASLWMTRQEDMSTVHWAAGCCTCKPQSTSHMQATEHIPYA